MNLQMAHDQPIALGMVDLHRIEGTGGIYRASLKEPVFGEVTVLVACSAREYPFIRHYRFVRHKGTGHPYTFSNMEFAAQPPGLRVGPWPGWRGIPMFPELTVSTGGGQVPLQPTFWGDEISSGLLRGVVRLSCEAATEVTVVSVDNRIVPLTASLYRTSALRSAPVAVSLKPEMAEIHPRLLITPEILPLLRVRKGSSHAHLWKKIRQLLNQWNLQFEKTPESKTPQGPERLSGEDRVLISALIAVIDQDEESFLRAQRAYSDYLAETQRPGFESLAIDTQTGEALFILCVGYDWLWQRMSSSEREECRKWLWHVADVCWSYLGYERSDYGQAHYLGCGLGLLAFSFLFWGEHPQAEQWARHLRGALDCTLRLLPADGFYPHGVNLWIYEFGFLFRWVELIRICAGEDLWNIVPGLERASSFRSSSLSPDGFYGVTFGDPQYRVGGDSWCHFLVAARTRSAHAQSVGLMLNELPHEGIDFRNIPARRRVYEFLYYDPSVVPEAQQKAAEHFRDGGEVFLRSDSSMFSFKAGPPLGSQRYRVGEYGAYGHSDPANGSFLLFRNHTFVGSGPGPVYRRETALHNVITIDGEGQIGDSTVWLPDFFPPEVLASKPEVRAEGSWVSMTVGLAQSYLPHLGVETLSRSLLADLDRYVIGVDMVRCRRGRSIEWNTHSWHEFTPAGGMTPLVFMLGDGVRLTILRPSGLQWQTGLTEFVPAYPHDGTRDYYLQAARHGEKVQFVWCYLFTGEQVPHLHQRADNLLQIRFDDGFQVSFDGQWLIPDHFHEHPA